LTVVVVFPIHATASGGLTHIDPGGGPVAGAAKAMGVHERFSVSNRRADLVQLLSGKSDFVKFQRGLERNQVIKQMKLKIQESA
jgi:hypothetical protein